MSILMADGQTKYKVIHKFGRSASTGTTYGVVAMGNVYRTPKLIDAAALRIKAGGNVNDTAAGSGAQSVTLQGLDETGEPVTEVLITAGASASANTVHRYSRLFRAYVEDSGTYSDIAAPAGHAGTIVIERASGSEDWATIDATDTPRGQTEIAAYTIPKGRVGFVQLVEVITDTTKTTSILMTHRHGAFDTAAPFKAPRVILQLGGLVGADASEPRSPFGPFKAGTDIAFLAKVSSATSEVDIDFEIILR